MKEIVIYLGSKCNMNCAYCHRESSFHESNVSNKLLDLVSQEPCKISFKGGEPLLYIDEIKKVVNASPFSNFVITTNGTLFDKHKDYLAQHNFLVCLSYDGENSLRDFNPLTKPIDYPRLGVVTTLYHGNCDLEKIINDFEKRMVVIGKPVSLYPHIMHGTNDNNLNYAMTENDYKMVLEQYKNGLTEYLKYIKIYGTINLRYRGLYRSLIDKFKRKFEYGETVCASDNIIRVDWNGDRFNCAYIRDFKLEDDWKEAQAKLIRYISPKCSNCSVYDMCGAGCLKSKFHELECMFYFDLLNWFKVFYENNKLTLNQVEKGAVIPLEF